MSGWVPADLVAPAAAVVEMGSVAVRERRGLQRFDNWAVGVDFF